MDRRALVVAGIVVVVLGVAVVGAGAMERAGGGVAGPAGAIASAPSIGPVGASGSPTAPSPSPPVASSPSTSAAPSPSPTPNLVPDPLDGLPVTPEDAARHPIAVMIDDLGPARPQSGFSSASIVWQAPAEGGIPRYMLIFSEGLPGDVGPVRSARYYFIAWAAEWRALYVHAGGSPQALDTLAASGNGQLVYNADQFANGAYFRRVTSRFPPHNLYTTGAQLRALASADGAIAPPSAAAWQFGPDAPDSSRPYGGSIEVDYPANRIVYRYDHTTNTYDRYVTSPTGAEVAQIDAASQLPVAPRNVIVMRMAFGPLNDGEPQKHRLEATVVGSGTAWIATNGLTIKGTWRKASLTAPTLFFDAAGQPVVLTAGQTFIQVMQLTDPVRILAGTLPT